MIDVPTSWSHGLVATEPEAVRSPTEHNFGYWRTTSTPNVSVTQPHITANEQAIWPSPFRLLTLYSAHALR